MELKNLLSAVEFTVSGEYDGNFEIEELCHDSRRTGEGKLFVCVKGATVDGHNYAASAYSRGCRHFVCERELGYQATPLYLRLPTPGRRLRLCLPRFSRIPPMSFILSE